MSRATGFACRPGDGPPSAVTAVRTPVGKTSTLVGLLAMISATPVLAAGPSPFVTSLMGREPGTGKTFACFRRDYDEAHLAEHPEQNVRALWILATAYSSLDYSVQMRMSVQVRDRQETFGSVAECGRFSARAATCAGPVGAKGMRVSIEGRRAILVSIRGKPHLWKPGPPDPAHSVNDAFNADDTVFRLERTALAQCDDQAFPDELPLVPNEP